LLAQVYVASGWAAVGDAHRLSRATALILAPLALALITYASQRSPDEGAYVLAFGLILGGLVFIATRTIAYVVLAISPLKQRDGKRWQISIVEMFGWTIVVALGSWAVTMSKLPELEHIHILWETLASIIPAAMIMALFLAPRPRHDRVSLLLAGAGMIAFYASVNLLGRMDSDDHGLFGALFGYVALWVLVIRLDEAATVEMSNEAQGEIRIVGPTEE
jgi:hypothetical protein